MASASVMRSVLRGFLGTYTSRNSDLGGYWLFGFLVSDLSALTVDLVVGAHTGASQPAAEAARVAIKRFHEQLGKARLAAHRIKEAALTITRLEGPARGIVNERASDGFQVLVEVTATMDTGRSYREACRIFVAPHNPLIERRRSLAVA
jgi:hypothetical protein